CGSPPASPRAGGWRGASCGSGPSRHTWPHDSTIVPHCQLQSIIYMGTFLSSQRFHSPLYSAAYVRFWSLRTRNFGLAGGAQVVAAVDLHYVGPQHLFAVAGFQLVTQFFNFLDVIADVIGMRKIGCPEEALGADQVDHRG